jgi:hypothetical protein
MKLSRQDLVVKKVKYHFEANEAHFSIESLKENYDGVYIEQSDIVVKNIDGVPTDCVTAENIVIVEERFSEIPVEYVEVLAIEPTIVAPEVVVETPIEQTEPLVKEPTMVNDVHVVETTVDIVVEPVIESVPIEEVINSNVLPEQTPVTEEVTPVVETPIVEEVAVVEETPVEPTTTADTDTENVIDTPIDLQA